MKDLAGSGQGGQAQARGIPGRRLLDLQPGHVRHQGLPGGDQIRPRPASWPSAPARSAQFSRATRSRSRPSCRSACRPTTVWSTAHWARSFWRRCKGTDRAARSAMVVWRSPEAWRDPSIWLVVGAGPGGYVAAIRATQLGRRRRWSSANAGGRLSELGLHPDQGAAALRRGLSHGRRGTPLWRAFTGAVTDRLAAAAQGAQGARG